MGCEHIRNLLHMPDVQICAIADPNQQSRQWAMEALAHQSPKFVDHHLELLPESLDAVIVATPNFTHIEVMRDLAATPWHILMEKPMCTSLNDGREFVRLSENRQPITWIAMEYRYMSTTTHFLDRLKDIGELKMLSIREHRFPFLPKVNNWNRFNKNTGGTLVEKCCHFFDLMNLATGDNPIRVMASGAQDVNHLDERYEENVPDILDNAYVIVDYENGVRTCLDLCMFAEGSRNEQALVATGPIAKLEAKIQDNTIELNFRDDRDGELYKVPVNPDVKYEGYHHGASYLRQLAFISAINSGSAAGVRARDGFKAMAVGIAAERSVKERTSIRIETC